MIINRLPLRYSIPLGILVFNLALMSINFLTDKQAMVDQTIQNSSENLEKVGLLLSSQVESSLRNDEKPEAREILKKFAGFRDIVHIYLVDNRQTIILSDDILREGTKLEEIPESNVLISDDTTIMQLSQQPYYNPSEQFLYNFNQISIRNQAESLIPQNNGYLIIVQDLKEEISQLQRPVRTRAWRDLGIYFLFSFLLWLLFHYAFLRRTVRLLKNFSEPENLNKKGISGRDEISSLARGFIDIHYRLGRSLTRYQTMLNNSNVAISELDARGRYTYVNLTWTRLFGYRAKEIIGKEPALLLRPEEPKSPMLEKLKSGEITHYSETRLFRNKEGKKIWCELYAGANHVEGKLESIVKVMFDISPLKKVQDELKKQNKFIRTILDNVPLGIAVNKMDEGNATYINKHFETVYGWPKAELTNVEEFFKKVYPEKAYREKIVKRTMEDIESRDPSRMKWENIEITTKNGDKRIISAENIPLYEQNLMISTVQDSTEKVKYKNDRDRIFEQSVDMVCTATMDGFLLTLNPAWEKVLGWTAYELKSKPFYNFIHPGDLDSTRKMATQLKQGKPVVDFENRYQTKKGDYRWLSWNTIPIPEEDIMLGIARDVTEAKNNAEKIKQSEEKFSKLFRNSPDAIMLSRYDDGKIIDLNHATVDILGHDYDEVIGRTSLEIRLWLSEAERNKYVRQLKNSGRVSNYECDLRVKSGETRSFRISGEKIELPDGLHILNILQDITKMKQVQEALVKSQQQLQNITDNIPGAILQYIMYPDGRDALIYVSEGVKEVWGISPELAKGNMQYVWDHIHGDDLPRVRESIADSYRKMIPWNQEFRNILADGTVKWTMGIGVPQKREDGSVIWDSLLLDITDRKHAEIQLRNYQEELKQLTMELSVAEERQRKTIAANIHDHLSQSLVISKMKLNDLEKEQSLQPYISVLQYIKNQISEALENSRKITYDLSPPILYEMGLVETMYWLTDKTEEENNLNIEFTTEFDELKLPEATMIMVYRAIQEILYNVIKHAAADKVTIRFSSMNNGLEVTVYDNGKGFNVPEALRTSTRKGFGLFTVQERIQNLSGKFSIESGLGKGTTVKLFIPLQSNS